MTNMLSCPEDLSPADGLMHQYCQEGQEYLANEMLTRQQYAPFGLQRDVWCNPHAELTIEQTVGNPVRNLHTSIFLVVFLNSTFKIPNILCSSCSHRNTSTNPSMIRKSRIGSRSTTLWSRRLSVEKRTSRTRHGSKGRCGRGCTSRRPRIARFGRACTGCSSCLSSESSRAARFPMCSAQIPWRSRRLPTASHWIYLPKSRKFGWISASTSVPSRPTTTLASTRLRLSSTESVRQLRGRADAMLSSCIGVRNSIPKFLASNLARHCPTNGILRALNVQADRFCFPPSPHSMELATGSHDSTRTLQVQVHHHRLQTRIRPRVLRLQTHRLRLQSMNASPCLNQTLDNATQCFNSSLLFDAFVLVL